MINPRRLPIVACGILCLIGGVDGQEPVAIPELRIG
jgi:hypothetical protein